MIVALLEHHGCHHNHEENTFSFEFQERKRKSSKRTGNDLSDGNASRHDKGIQYESEKWNGAECIDKVGKGRILGKEIQLCSKQFTGRHQCNTDGIKQWKQDQNCKHHICRNTECCSCPSLCKSFCFIAFSASRSSSFDIFPTAGTAIFSIWLISNSLPSSQYGT